MTQQIVLPKNGLIWGDHSSIHKQGRVLNDLVLTKFITENIPEWYRIEPVAEELLNAKLQPNYPQFWVLIADTKVVEVTPPVPPVADTVTREQIAAAILVILDYLKQ
jgi:hypothetical protein